MNSPGWLFSAGPSEGSTHIACGRIPATTADPGVARIADSDPRRAQSNGTAHKVHPAVVGDQSPVEKVHRRRAEKTGNKAVRRAIVNIKRRRDLLNPPGRQHNHAIAERQRLRLIVSDEERGRPPPPMGFQQVRLKLFDERLIEVSQRLVEQIARCLADQHSPKRYAPPLAAGNCRRLTIQERGDRELLGGSLHTALDLASRPLAKAERKGEILSHAQMRIECRVLEGHRYVAPPRRKIVDQPLADADHTRSRMFEPRYDPQQRRFTGSRRSDHHDKLAVGHVERKPIERLHAAGEDLRQVVDEQPRQGDWE